MGLSACPMTTGETSPQLAQQTGCPFGGGFAIHSTFRDSYGDPLRPQGLRWNMGGTSHVTFLPPERVESFVDTDLSSHETRRQIVEAYNRWAFAKGLPFHVESEIQDVVNTGTHLQVMWKIPVMKRVFKESKKQDMERFLKEDPSAKVAGYQPAEVWMNGVYAGKLDGPESLPPLLDHLATIPSKKLVYKRSEDGIIRIERFYRGMLYNRTEITDHILDNLIALEDVQILDSRTLIGTATLPDWIMGGQLTSRMWVRDNGDSVLFLRPLRNDDVENSVDRRFEVFPSSPYFTAIQAELKRLFHLANLDHPFHPPTADGRSEHETSLAAIRENLQKNKPPRKKFGL